MTRDQWREIMKAHEIAGPDGAGRAINFVRELLEGEKAHLEQIEPHATASIQWLETAAGELRGLEADLLDLF